MGAKLLVPTGAGQVPLTDPDKMNKAKFALGAGFHFTDRQHLLGYLEGRIQLPPEKQQIVDEMKKRATAKLQLAPQNSMAGAVLQQRGLEVEAT